MEEGQKTEEGSVAAGKAGAENVFELQPKLIPSTVYKVNVYAVVEPDEDSEGQQALESKELHEKLIVRSEKLEVYKEDAPKVGKNESVDSEIVSGL